jgi:hypothetical protein
MKEETKQILLFLKENFKSFPACRFSPKSSAFLTILFQLIGKADEEFEKISNITIKEVSDGESHSYIPGKIKSRMENMKRYSVLVNFLIIGRHYIIKMTLFQNTSRLLLEKYIKRIYLWLYVASHFAGKGC